MIARSNRFKYVLLLGFVVFFVAPIDSQGQTQERISRKGRMFASWGYNWSAYSKSDIHLYGAGYDYTLYDVAARDEPVQFDFGKYFNISKISVPQYNFRIGYFLNEKYSLSVAWDHLKYVMVQGQTVDISGTITDGGDFNGEYNREPIKLVDEFLRYEHTNGLNSANVEIRRYEPLYTSKVFRVELVQGLGIGLLIPRTDANLFDQDNYDAFHLSGYELHGMIALRTEIGKTWFLMSEFKAGYNTMHDIRTTLADTDRAEQHFYSYLVDIIVGANFGLPKFGKRVND